MAKVIFIDDEGFFIKRYRESLETRFDVHYCDKAADGLAYLQTHSDVDAVVLDIMMPTPDGVSDFDTSGGLDTGIWLLGHLMVKYNPWTLPLLILTNRNVAIVRDVITKLRLPAHLVEVRAKIETPAFFLPSVVESLIERNRGTHP